MELFDVGFTNKSISSMLNMLRPHFQSGTYDLLRKNCNSFSDCALWFLLKERLPSTYNSMEKLGNTMQKLVMQNSEYTPNPKADNFDKEKVIELCTDKLVFKKTEGMKLGGQNALSQDEVRKQRLAKLQAKFNQ